MTVTEIGKALGDEERGAYSAAIPRKVRGSADTFRESRLEKNRVNCKVNYYVNKIRVLMFINVNNYESVEGDTNTKDNKKRKYRRAADLDDDDDCADVEGESDETVQYDDIEGYAKRDDNSEEKDGVSDITDTVSGQAILHPLARDTFDNYEAPIETWKKIAPHISKEKTIWECFYSNGKSGNYLF